MKTSITHAELGWNEAGTPVSDQFDDVYFSNVNGLEETRYVFLKQNHIPHRWHEYDQRRFVIAETGFGTGLNFLAVWQCFSEFRRQNPDSPLRELHFISFEKYPLSRSDLIKAHLAWPELEPFAKQLHQYYPPAVPDCHRIVLEGGVITLDLWFGDIKDCMPQVPVYSQGLVDAWFLDGFAPSKNPEMWNQGLFNGMAQMAKQDCTCATFTSAGFVRRGLIEAGFAMKKVKGFGTKREMIAGVMPQRVPYTNIKPWYDCRAVDDLQDVAIIGGGVASATLAVTLARRGIRVSLYCEDESPAQGASGNRQGAIYPLLNGPHEGMSRVFAPAFLFARQFVEQAVQQLQFDHDWCGVTQLLWDEQSQQKLIKITQGQFDTELVHYLNPQQTSETVGLHSEAGSLHYPLGGWLCPAEFTRALFDDLSLSGRITTHYRQQVEQLSWDETNRQWTLTCGVLSFRHQAVVVATGYQFDQFRQTATLPLGKVKGQVSHIPTTQTLSQMKSVLCYDGYMTPHNPANGEHCIGASYDRAHIDGEFDGQAQQQNGDKLRHCLPPETHPWTRDVDTSGNHSRRGIRCVSRDHLPFVGNIGDLEQIQAEYQNLQQQSPESAARVASYPNLYALLGLGSRGLSSAPLMAEFLASVMCSDPLPLPVEVTETLHPSRMWIRKLRKGKALTER